MILGILLWNWYEP